MDKITLGVTALVNTAAMAAALNVDDDLLYAWSDPVVGLYQKIGEWATIVTEEETILEQAMREHDEEWPGVFAYEVTEEVGRKIRASIVDGTIPDGPQVRAWVRTIIGEYCTTEWMVPILATYNTMSLSDEH